MARLFSKNEWTAGCPAPLGSSSRLELKVPIDSQDVWRLGLSSNHCRERFNHCSCPCPLVFVRMGLGWRRPSWVNIDVIQRPIEAPLVHTTARGNWAGWAKRGSGKFRN
mmetsp:Transcript_4063/g.5772  ORF Transcript_4063/g.5772 Transcript_4063/m.5772 type:complete len:109 (+) Transcript_4063:497-823(+)